MLDYEGQIRSAVINGFGSAVVNQPALSALPLHDLLIVYWNWCNRGIPAADYSVHRSQVLQLNPLSSDPRYAPALAHIEQLLSSRGDVTPHLSRRIMHGFEVPSGTSANLARRRDLDLLINDWGIHHLHLSTNIETDGFVERTGPLLFAAVKDGKAHLIDILPHGGWTDTHLIEVCVREWPTADLALEMKGVLGLRYNPTPDERKKLRNAGINVPVEVDGKFYMGRVGMSTAGTPTPAVFGAGNLVRRVKAFAELLDKDPTEIDHIITAGGGTPPPNADWTFNFLPQGYGMLDRVTGIVLRLA